MSRERKLLIILSIVCLVLQVGIAPYIAILGVVPNFMLLPVVCAGIVEGRKTGCIAGFLCGLAYDLCGTGPIGLMALVCTLAGYFAAYAAQNILATNWLVAMLVLLLAAFIAELCEAILLAMVGSASFPAAIVSRVLPGMLYDTVFGFICFPLVRKYLHLTSSAMHPGDSRKPMEVKNINLR